MTTSEPKPGEAVRDVHFSEDALSVDLADGRTITVSLVWFGVRGSTGQMSMKISARKACCEAHRRRVLPLALDRPSLNPRLQRTRLRSPLSRKPLARPNSN